MTDGQVEVFNRRVSHVEGSVSEVRSTVKQMDTKLDGITETLTSLVRIEERQIAQNERLSSGVQVMNDHEHRLRAVEKELPDNLDKRLAKIETAMPQLLESRKWVVSGVLSGVGMIGVAVVALVLKG